MSSARHLERIKGLSEAKVLKAKEAAGKVCRRLGFQTANDLLLKRERDIVKITTGSAEFDKILGGGIETGSLTEVHGEWRTGKTQLALTLSVTSLMAEEQVPALPRRACARAARRVLTLLFPPFFSGRRQRPRALPRHGEQLRAGPAPADRRALRPGPGVRARQRAVRAHLERGHVPRDAQTGQADDQRGAGPARDHRLHHGRLPFRVRGARRAVRAPAKTGPARLQHQEDGRRVQHRRAHDQPDDC